MRDGEIHSQTGDSRQVCGDLGPQGTPTGALCDVTPRVNVIEVLGGRARIIDAPDAAAQFKQHLRVLGSGPALAGLDAETAGRIDR